MRSLVAMLLFMSAGACPATELGIPGALRRSMKYTGRTPATLSSNEPQTY
jgi:hypothetical protein